MSISDSEWIVLEVLWDSNPRSADEIIENIPDKFDWKPATVRTLINRLLKKKFIDFEKDGRKFMYYPAYNRKDCLNKKNVSFLKNIYGGISRKFFAAFVDDFISSEDELNELRSLLAKKENELKKRGEE